MAEGNSWKVTDTASNQVTINDAGKVVEGVITYFLTGTGGEGSVFTPNTQFEAKLVEAQIDEAALKLDRVRQLQRRAG